MRRLLLPVLCAVALAGIIELAVQLRYHPGFWQKTAWLLHDPYRGELFDRMVVFEKLSHFEDSDPDIISVGDSSGFFALQSTIVNRYLHGTRYLSLNTGANHAFVGYKAMAEYMLRRSQHIKWVVLYVFPQLLPVEGIIDLADLGPIAEDNLVGLKSKIMPPSASLSLYAKTWVFTGYKYHVGQPLLVQGPALQLHDTINVALGWLPEFDVRFDRIDGRLPFFPDTRTGWYNQLGLTDPSSINAVLGDFRAMVRSYGARLAIAFAPFPERAIIPGDPNIAISEAAFARFNREHPDVKFLFPLITRWSSEKIGTSNHISREYTFLSSERTGKALARLVTDPASIPLYSPSFKGQQPYAPITFKPIGPPDPDLLKSALAFYMYTSTLDELYHDRISTRVLSLLSKEQAYQYMMEDARARMRVLADKRVKLGIDLSQLRATPVALAGMSYCGARPDTQWVHIYGVINFSYSSPTITTTEPVRWPESSNILIPTIIEDGLRKFDGYCPEPSMADAALASG